MAQDIVSGLFGLAPWQIQQQQQAALQQRADQYANMQPLQRAASGMFQAGGQLGGMLAKGMGMVDPAQQESQARQAALAGLDVSNPEAILQRAAQIQDPRLKMQLTMLAQQLKAQQSDAAYKQAQAARLGTQQMLDLAQAQKALRENPNLATTEVGVEGKPGWTQMVLIDKSNPAFTPVPVGAPKQSAAAMRVELGGGGAKESIQPIPYIDPATGKATWGTIADARGKPAAAYDPVTKQLLATEGARGKEIGAASGKAQVTLAGADADVSKVKAEVEGLLSHPGFESTVGATVTPGMRFVPGSREASFMERFNQVKGGAFLRAYETLKGGGQITEIEGKKATDAINRMSISQSEQEFKAAAKDFVAAVESGYAKLRKQAAGAANSPVAPAAVPGGWSIRPKGQ